MESAKLRSLDKRENQSEWQHSQKIQGYTNDSFFSIHTHVNEALKNNPWEVMKSQKKLYEEPFIQNLPSATGPYRGIRPTKRERNEEFRRHRIDQSRKVFVKPTN